MGGWGLGTGERTLAIWLKRKTGTIVILCALHQIDFAWRGLSQRDIEKMAQRFIAGLSCTAIY
jgi:hypothetical protein